jgi:hypothetical protein
VVSVPYARLFFRALCWQRESVGTTLCEILRTTASAKLEDTSDGQIITGSSSNGASVTFAPPGGRALSPTDLVELCSNLLDLYDAAVADLGDEATDAEISAWILDRLVENRRTVTSFVGLVT